MIRNYSMDTLRRMYAAERIIVCGIPFLRFTARQLRHTYATMLYDAGVDVKTAQDFLGHADQTVTMNIYTHLSTQKKDKAIHALQQHFADTIPEAL